MACITPTLGVSGRIQAHHHHHQYSIVSSLLRTATASQRSHGHHQYQIPSAGAVAFIQMSSSVKLHSVERGELPTAPGRPARALHFAQKIAEKVLDRVERNLDKDEVKKKSKSKSAPALPSTVDPQVQLEGNFSPVAECAVQHELQVEGDLPACLLEGVYVRNGPNPQFFPTGRHHLFDGDGMLHAVTFNGAGSSDSSRSVSYACRYTRTYRFKEEERCGRAFFPKPIGELHGYGGVAKLLMYWARSLLGILDRSQGMGMANAGIVWFNNRLLAISEDDLPVEVRLTEDNDIETVGRYDFHGQLQYSMIAHPKVDPATGELFSLSYNVLSAPYLKYLIFSSSGHKIAEVPVTLPEAAMTHDFAITQNFVVIPDQQIVFRLKEMLTGGSPVVLDTTKTPRFGVMPRYATSESELQWIPLPGDCFFFHLTNAWEEDDGNEIVVIGSCMTPADIIFKTSEVPRATLTEIRLNRTTGASQKRELSDLNLEVGKNHPNYVGVKTQFMYLAIVEPWPKVSGIAKVDLQAGQVVARFNYGPNRFGGEPVFVPRSCAANHANSAEDDGFLLAFMHDESSGRSELLVLDATSPSLEQVASVKLPSRVPYGFHGAFIPATGHHHHHHTQAQF